MHNPARVVIRLLQVNATQACPGVPGSTWSARAYSFRPIEGTDQILGISSVDHLETLDIHVSLWFRLRAGM